MIFLRNLMNTGILIYIGHSGEIVVTSVSSLCLISPCSCLLDKNVHFLVLLTDRDPFWSDIEQEWWAYTVFSVHWSCTRPKLYFIYYRIFYFSDERKFVAVAKQSERRKVWHKTGCKAVKTQIFLILQASGWYLTFIILTAWNER